MRFSLAARHWAFTVTWPAHCWFAVPKHYKYASGAVVQFTVIVLRLYVSLDHYDVAEMLK